MDGFTSEANAFVRQYDRLGFEHQQRFSDFPERERVRPLLSMAKFLSVQRTNPLMTLSPQQTLVVDLADAFLQWAGDPGNPARWETMFELRAELDSE